MLKAEALRHWTRAGDDGRPQAITGRTLSRDCGVARSIGGADAVSRGPTTTLHSRRAVRADGRIRRKVGGDRALAGPAGAALSYHKEIGALTKRRGANCGEPVLMIGCAAGAPHGWDLDAFDRGRPGGQP